MIFAKSKKTNIFAVQTTTKKHRMYKATIGTNAGKVWHALQETTEIKLPDLATKLCLSVEDTALAIGWLARESKIFIRQKDNEIWVSEKPEIMFSFG